MPLSIEQHERLNEIKHLLDEKEAQPEPPYWFYDGETDYDEAASFCYDCIMTIMPDAVIGENFGGGYCMEVDSCEHCGKCEKLLQYTLTDEGVKSELAHYAEHIAPEALNNPDECYHLARLAYGMYTDKQKKEFLRSIEKVITRVSS